MSDPIESSGTAFSVAVASVRSGQQTQQEAVQRLLGQLTFDEVLWLLDGDLPALSGFLGMARRYNGTPFVGGRIDRLGIPGIRFTDGPRGVTVGSSTCFPVAIARAATFDPDLERTVGDAIGAEARAQGANLFAGICVNLAYDPGWGRAQESYGEDPLLLGAMGTALADGVQPWVLSCVKHFALNSMEQARFRVDVRVAPDTLREVYLPHFRMVVEAGADAVMSSYNAVNGQWAGQSRELLTEILREEMGFTGFVMSDFIWGFRDPVESVRAGQDLEMPFRQQRAAALPAALRDGDLNEADVRRCATRLLNAQVDLALRSRPQPPRSVIASTQHRALARRAAHRGCVMLRNQSPEGEALLPLSDQISSLAVLGPLADQPNQGDVGSSRVYPPESATILEALRARFGGRIVRPETPDPSESAQAASGADAAVVVVGLTSVDEGESLIGVDTRATQLLGGIARFRPVAGAIAGILKGVARRKKLGGDRPDLRLHPADVALIRAVSAANPHTVVVVICGGTVVVDPWDTQVSAVLVAWYPGMEGGEAMADILLGVAEPGGRLPVAIPHRRADLPVLVWNADTATYGPSWGQRKLDHDGVPAAYPFGFGLGYTTFEIRDLAVGDVDDGRFRATVTLANTGDRGGRHVVQIYACRDLPGGRTVRDLLGFCSLEVAAGSSALVHIDCSVAPLQRWTGDRFVVDPQTIRVEAASFSGDPAAPGVLVRVGAP